MRNLRVCLHNNHREDITGWTTATELFSELLEYAETSSELWTYNPCVVHACLALHKLKKLKVEITEHVDSFKLHEIDIEGDFILTAPKLLDVQFNTLFHAEQVMEDLNP